MNRVMNVAAMVVSMVLFLICDQLNAAVVNITQGSTSGYTMTDGNTYVMQNSVSFSNTTAGYNVPFKGGKRKSITFNWNYKPHLAVYMEEIYRAFVRRDSVDVADELKLLETLGSHRIHRVVCWSALHGVG